MSHPKNTKRAQALILAALIVAATIYVLYAVTLTFTQTQTQPTQQEAYTEALIQALADGSPTQNTTLAQQRYSQYLAQASAAYLDLNMSPEIVAQPVFEYYGYNQKLCVRCTTAAAAIFGPYAVEANLTLISHSAPPQKYTLRLTYTVDGQPIAVYQAQAYTSITTQTEWVGDTLIVVAQSDQTFTLNVTAPWGLTLICLL